MVLQKLPLDLDERLSGQHIVILHPDAVHDPHPLCQGLQLGLDRFLPILARLRRSLPPRMNSCSRKPPCVSPSPPPAPICSPT